MKILVKKTIATEAERYNGGWAKTILKLDKSKTNGYSIVGDFIKGPQNLEIGSLVLDCDLAGSRKNQTKNYRVLKVSEKGDLKKIEGGEILGGGMDWAVNLWEIIEKNLPKTEKTLEEKILSSVDFTDAEKEKLLSLIK